MVSLRAYRVAMMMSLVFMEVSSQELGRSNYSSTSVSCPDGGCAVLAMRPPPAYTGMDMIKMLASAISNFEGEQSVSRIHTDSLIFTDDSENVRKSSSNSFGGGGRSRNPLRKRKQVSSSAKMTRHLLDNSTAVCNDGSSAGYYLRTYPGSKKWIIFLEGGWYCFDIRTCIRRWRGSRNLMSSSLWKDSRVGTGIISHLPSENPTFWNANHVYIPYCSSDLWSGAKHAGRNGEFSFMGSVIIEKVVEDLLMNRGLRLARSLTLAGSSAGAVGVFVNVDRVAQQVKRVSGRRIKVRGLADSGWFLDNVPFRKNVDCTDVHNCNAIQSIQTGYKFWRGNLPSSCVISMPPEDRWKCFLGYQIMTTLKTPTFVVQWRYDEAQITIDNVGNPISEQQWNYIQKSGDTLAHSLKNVTGVFVPSCIAHTLLTNSDWLKVKINGLNLAQTYRCWQMRVTNKHQLSERSSLYLSDIRTNTSSLLTRSSGRSWISYTSRRDICSQIDSVRLIDKCEHPQCNNSCPRLYNALIT